MQLPFTDATLRFSLPLPGLSMPLRIVLCSAAALAVFFLVWWLYRRELRMIDRRVARLLLGLRLLLLACLAIAFFGDPTLTRSRTEIVPSRVLVAVDLSDSMRVSDPNRPAHEKLRLARSLKIAIDLASDADLESWAASAEAGRSMGFLSESERSRYEQVLARLNTVPRLEICRRLLGQEGANLIDELRKTHTVDLLGFCPELSPLPLDATRLAKALAELPFVEGRPLVCSDLKLPLTRALETADPGDGIGAKLIATILLTDGRHNWGTSPVTQGAELGARGITLDAIAIGPREAPADVAIVSARAAAATVFKGSTVPVDVAVRVSGWPAGTIEVKLENPDSKKPPLMETIEHAGPDAIYQLSFKAKMDEPGPQRLAVIAEAGPNDRFPQNNRRNVRVNVVKDRARVLILDGEARWEFHYLHTCLGRDPNMDVRSIVFRQPRIGKVNEDQLKLAGVPARKLPDDLNAITSYDAIIVGDVELSQMTREQRMKLEHYVAETGGTLILSAGKRSMPLAYLGQENEPFERLLPIKNPRVLESVEGFPLAMSPGGERSWFLAMGDTTGESRAVWERMPQHYWAIVGDAKDGAEVLAKGPGDVPLITRQNYGFGRVLFVGIDSTWRWRFKTGDYYHHRFWGQVAQWAASDRLLPVSNAAGTIRFGPREPIYSGGQDVEVVVRVAEDVKPLTPQARKAAKIIRLPAAVGGAESTAGLVPLTTPEHRPLDLQGRIADLTPGKYAVELDIPEWAEELIGPPAADGRTGKLRAYFEITPPENDELIDLSANWPLLTEMAEAGHGIVVTPDQTAKILERLKERSATREVSMAKPLRQSWATLAIFLTLLSLEWIVRKWAGLP